MSDFTVFLSNLEQTIQAADGNIADLQKALLEIEEYIDTAAYQELDFEARETLQNTRKELRETIRQAQENDQPPQAEQDLGEPLSAPGSDRPAVNAAQDLGTAPDAPPESRDPLAEQHMEAAEKLFYSGRYAEAINLFDRVLQAEPHWDRARQHRAEAENYLRTGYIPTVALPADAASAYGKAQSAARVGRYQDALALVEKAQANLRELGIQRWQEGQEFAQKLQENIDAEAVYEEGMRLFGQGQIDEAIERVETALRATGLPKYEDRAEAMRAVKSTLRELNETLSQAVIEPAALSQIKANLDRLNAEFGANPAFERARERLKTAIPRVVEPLKEETRSLKTKAERAASLEEALYLANTARANLNQIRNLEGVDESLDRLQTETERLVRQVQKLDDDLERAKQAYDRNRNWPAEAWRISAEARESYPNDPEAAALNRQLRRFRYTRAALGFGGVILGLLILYLLGSWGVNRFQAYQLAQTPTATLTPTTTATLTPTATATSTPTATLTPSVTPTFTPTPIAGVTLREVWARNGCYEGFSAVGKIPSGATLRFLPSERRFDSFNRECLLVEFQGESGSVIGWVLLADIDALQQGVGTPTPAP